MENPVKYGGARETGVVHLPKQRSFRPEWSTGYFREIIWEPK
jgi:hypothetical protein